MVKGKKCQSNPEKLRKALEDLGPIFVKLGQVLSTRPDLIPIEITQELSKLQVELLKFQNHVKDKGLKILMIFEGRDAAGKGGTIKRITEHLNPRGARVVALEKPSDIEASQWYFQRYIEQLPKRLLQFLRFRYLPQCDLE